MLVSTQKIWRPLTLEEAWEVIESLDQEEYCFVAGGTWLRTQWESNLRPYAPNLISLENIEQISEIREDFSSGQHEIIIGSGVTLTNCLKSDLLKRYVHTLIEAIKKIAALSIRNQATIGGNVMTAAGDSITSLLVEKAELIWFKAGFFELETLEGWLDHTKTNDKRILAGIKIKTEEKRKDSFSFFTKVGRREAFTASILTIAGKGTVTEDGVYQDVVLAAAGGKKPGRLKNTENRLCNTKHSNGLLQWVHKEVQAEFQATSDPFSTASYKRMVAANSIVSEFYQLHQEVQKGGGSLVVES
ncbi:FAD binding domain-containing protein [Halalkalibacter akibai]|uniref:Xanthine dehydrogenase n=1 Tax=Halalkalibacter akibai (strain ATCC 43226 / DSM 21942 / CIP 109018 / JCM 9157 / 1139) TaxID=1236973 RepID=W4QZD9_HALA3|nr:FAD binding domain-containing protein [Halalkalibacter akibai]GAE37033.1 xanthine dehydrogenase [Halalkalibacter akibai JCM 9157]